MSNLRGNVHDLITDQGSTVHQVFGINNSARQQLVLTGYVARMQIREWNTETSDPASTIIADYTTENGYLTVNEASGSVTLLIPPADMASYSPKSSVYDLEFEPPTVETTRLIQEKFLVRVEEPK